MTTEPSPQTRSRARRLVRAIVSGTVVAVAVTAIALLIREKFDPLVRIDEGAVRAATDVTRSHEGFRGALIAWQELTQPINLYVVASALCLWVWLGKGLRTRAWWAFLTMMIGWSLALALKYLVQRARPIVQDPVSHAPGYSFPSGHAANAAIVAVAVVLLLWPLLGRTGRGVAIGLAALLVLATALDRVFLGVHFPSDVTAGILLGTGLVGASYLGYLGWNPADPAHTDATTTREAVR